MTGQMPRTALTDRVADLLHATIRRNDGAGTQDTVDDLWVAFYLLRPTASELYAIACGLAQLVGRADPTYTPGKLVRVVPVDPTGRIIDDPDAEVAGPHERGALTAARFVAAVLNLDADMATALAISVFEADPHDRGCTVHQFCVCLMNLAARAMPLLSTKAAQS